MQPGVVAINGLDQITGSSRRTKSNELTVESDEVMRSLRSEGPD